MTLQQVGSNHTQDRSTETRPQISVTGRERIPVAAAPVAPGAHNQQQSPHTRPTRLQFSPAARALAKLLDGTQPRRRPQRKCCGLGHIFLLEGLCVLLTAKRQASEWSCTLGAAGSPGSQEHLDGHKGW